MDATASAQPTSTPFPRVASTIHTVAVLAVLAVWALSAKILTAHQSTAANHSPVRPYIYTMLLEWFIFAVTLAGVRHYGTPLRAVLGDRWSSAGKLFRDIGIALAFWLVAQGVLYLVGRLLHVVQDPKMSAMFPHGGIQIALWVALSVTAGICEETIFRGYLQTQFMALTKNAPAGILLSAAAFGAAHAYQGFRMTILIAVFGLMFGILAHWRGSIRPGIIAHAWQDSVSGIVAGLLNH